MRPILLLCFAISVLGTGCGGQNPHSALEATDQEAIYNVLFNDHSRWMTLELVTSEIPDTMTVIDDHISGTVLYWHAIDSTTEQLNIDIAPNPVPSPVGLVSQANVAYVRTVYGTFRGMRYNATADSIERVSKLFSLRGTRSAICQRWGLPSGPRRGWLLTAIGDAQFSASGGQYHFLNSLRYVSSVHPETTFVFGSRAPENVPTFAIGESLAVTFSLADTGDFVLIYVPAHDLGYQLASTERLPNGRFRFYLAVPNRRMSGQVRFLVINAGYWSNRYLASGFSFNYQTR